MDRNIKRKKIIEDSIMLMYLNGYHATSVNDLAEAAGIPKSTFYSFFKSKEEYAIYALGFYNDEINYKNLQLLEDESIKPLDRIINFYKSKIANMEQKEYKYGCFVGNLTQEMGDVNKSIAKTTNTLHNMVSSKILLCILEAKEKYGYNPVSKPQILANYINNSWQGALVRMKSSENREPLDEFYTILIEVLLK